MASKKTTAKDKAKSNGSPSQGKFSWFACAVAHLSGRPATFLIALLCVAVWGLMGPYFHYSDTWQLVINTSTTIITFLMVFLIQNTQNRDSLAFQIKLSELIIAMHGAKNKLATAEDLSEEELQRLHNHYREGAERVMQSLANRKAAAKTASKRK